MKNMIFAPLLGLTLILACAALRAEDPEPQVPDRERELFNGQNLEPLENKR